MKKLRRKKITAHQPPLSDDMPGVACWSCGGLENCADCAERRRQIDAYAGCPARGPGELREDTRRSYQSRPPGPVS